MNIKKKGKVYIRRLAVAVFNVRDIENEVMLD